MNPVSPASAQCVVGGRRPVSSGVALVENGASDLGLEPLGAEDGGGEEVPAASPDLEAEAAESGPAVKPRRKPAEPTAQEILEHGDLHEPYRAWCAACVAGRGLSDRHLAEDSTEEALARVGIDWGFLGSEEGATPLLCAKDSKQRWYFGVAVPRKGLDDWAVAQFCRQLSLAGHKRMIVLSDSEPAMLAFKRAVQAKLAKDYGVEIVPEDAHRSSQSNSLAEQAVREIKQKTRSLRHSVYLTLGVKVAPESPVMTWLVSWAALSINMGRRGADGRTAWELRHGRPCKRLTAGFGEAVLWKKTKAPRGVEDRWLKGIWLGLALRSENSFVSDENGDVHEARTFKRLAGAEAKDLELFNKVRGTPWKPVLEVGERPARLLIDAAPEVPEEQLPQQPSMPEPTGPRRVYIRANVELKDPRIGYTPGCDGCLAAQCGLPAVAHNAVCRARIEAKMAEFAEGKRRLEEAKRRQEGAEASAVPMQVEPPPVQAGGSSSSAAGGPRVPGGPGQEAAAPAEAGGAPGTLQPASGAAPGAGSATQGVPPPPPAVGQRRKRRAAGAPTDADEDLQATHSQRVESLDGALIAEIRLASERCTGACGHVSGVDFAELFNPGVFEARAKTFGLTPGGVFDLRRGYNLSLPGDRARCWAELQEQDPHFVLGAPLCGPFSSWQNMPGNQASPSLQEKIKEATEHLAFCCKIYLWQVRRGRCFLHEHPWSASSWKLDILQEVMAEPGVDVRRGDQCPFGQKATDDQGEGLVEKSTGWMSNCPELLDAVGVRCSNLTAATDAEKHRHVKLQGSKTQAAERYPPRLIIAILRAIRAYLRRWREGSCWHIEELDTGPTLDEPPPEFQPGPVEWGPTVGERFFDNVTGFELDKDLVRKARIEEMEFMIKLKVWRIVDINECHAVTGHPPITVSWVDVNKGDDVNVLVRSRLVLNETKRVSGHMEAGDVFSATPPLECIRMQCSLFMSLPRKTLGDDRTQDVVLRFLDISRAHPHCPMRRDVYSRLPQEHPDAKDPTKCGKLEMTLYGARDAGQNFELTVYEVMTDTGAIRGETNSCTYRHEQRPLSVYHHGDDFAILGERRDTEWLTAQISARFIVKDRGCLGPRDDDLKEFNLLHRVLKYYPPGAEGGERIEYQADPRHAEIIVKQCGLQGSETKGVVTPGVKEPVTDELLKPLSGAEATELYRSICMRIGYLALDRPDLQYAAKEIARGMSAPTMRHLHMMKRIARYLVHSPGLVWVWRKQRWPGHVLARSDTDWAGCPVTRKSTNGTAVLFGGHCWMTQSSTQVPISLSSGEAEFYGLVKTGSRAIGIHNLCKDLGFLLWGELTLEVSTDSSAAKGVAVRRGVGKIRHLETGSLWVQAAVAAKRFALSKVDGTKNEADLMTKFIDRATLVRHLAALRLRVSKERPKSAPQALDGSALHVECIFRRLLSLVAA